MRPALFPLTLVGLLVVAACGGGGAAEPDGGLPLVSPTYTLDARLYESLSGTVANDDPDDVLVRHGSVAAGDRPDRTTLRGFYTFITADLPAGASIQSAVFTTRQYVVHGYPFASLGDVIVDHVDVGEALDAPDYGHAQWTLDLGTLSANRTEGWRTLDVTDAVRADFAAGRGTTTLRLRHRSQTDLDGTSDRTMFTAPSWTTDDFRMTLVITYTLP